MLISVQQSDSVLYLYICILFHILFHYGLSQGIEYSSLCYTVGPLYLFIYLAVLGLSCIMQDLLLRPLGSLLWRVDFSLVVAPGLQIARAQ